MSSSWETDPTKAIAQASRAYAIGMIDRRRLERVIDFCLRCERQGCSANVVLELPTMREIEEAEADRRRVLSPTRRARHALIGTLKAAL